MTKYSSKHSNGRVALEGSSTVIGNFKKRFPHYRVQLAETYAENYESDAKLTIIILLHAGNPLVLLSRFRIYLRTGGKIIIVVPNVEMMNHRLE